MSKLNNIIFFTIGAAIGSVVTWKLTKTKYEQIAQEEIDSVKEAYSKKDKGEASVTEESAEDDEQTTVNEIINESGYSADVKREQMVMDLYDDDTIPYVIPPEEFGEMDYERVSYTYYADKVLADDYDEPVEDIEGTIGRGSLETFGEFEDDSVFVRNDALKKDFEILLDLRNFADIHPDEPVPHEED